MCDYNILLASIRCAYAVLSSVAHLDFQYHLLHIISYATQISELDEIT